MKNLTEVITELFMCYARTEEFVSLNEAARNEFIDQVEQLKELASEK